MATTYGLAAELQALTPAEVPTGGNDKAFLYASGSGANTVLYAKMGNNTQVALMTAGNTLEDTANGGIGDFTFDGTSDVTIKVDPTNATAITAVADADLILVADADDSNNLKKITRANFIESAALDAINIDGGAIDGTPIGAAAQSTAKFTTLSASGDFNVASNAFVEGTLNVTGASTFTGKISGSGDLNVVGNSFVEGTLNVTGAATFAGALVGTSMSASADLNVVGDAFVEGSLNVTGALNLAGALAASALSSSGDLNVVGSAFIETNMNITGNLVANGDIDLGNATSDTITATGRFDSDLVPSTDSARALGTSALQWSAAHVDVGHIDQLGSALDANSQAITNINVDSGAIDGVTIGTNSAATRGVFTHLTASHMKIDNNLIVVGDLQVQGNIDSITVTQNTLEVTDKLIVAGASGSSAAVSGGGLMIGGSDLANDEVAAVLWDHGNSSLDFNIGTTTEIRLADGVLRPETDNDVDLGASGAQFKDLYLHGVAHIDDLRADALGAALDANDQAITNINVDSGAIDGTVIGANNAAAGTFAALVATSMSASADLNVVGNAFVEGDHNVSGALNVAGAFAASALSSSGDLNVVGSAFIETNLNVTGNAVVQGSLTANGATTLGNAGSDIVTVTGQLTASEGLLVSSGGNLDFAAAADINIVSGSATALEIKEGNNNYMAFITNQQAGGAISVGSNDVVSLFPQVDSNVTLGAASFAWKTLYVDAIDLQGQGSISMGGTGRIDLDADDDTSIRASADDVITFEVAGVDEFQMSANMFGPASADGASLGGASNEWSDLYLADSGVIYFGSDQDILLTHDADQGLTLEQGTDAAGDPILTLKTVGDLASGAELKFALDNGAGEADDDQLGAITFYGDDDGDNATKYAEIKVIAQDVTDTEEDGSITLSALVAGTLRDIMVIGDVPANSAGVTLPNDSTYGTMKAHSFVTYSDESLKTNIQPVENALEKVKSLKGVTYDWKSDGSSDIGFIAQEVEKVVPQIVKSNGNEGSYAMNYSRVTALLVEGIKEQQAQIENLKKALKSIKK